MQACTVTTTLCFMPLHFNGFWMSMSRFSCGSKEIKNTFFFLREFHAVQTYYMVEDDVTPDPTDSIS